MTPAELIALVQCPPLPDKHTPREQASPSALQQWAACPRSWGERYLHGRRETSLTWEEASALPEPPKPPRGCSALEKATLEQAKKAWNKLRRPALGTEDHAILGAYMLQNTPGAWHPPMVWKEVDWTSLAGQIARPACDVLPDPRGLVAVYTELAVEVEAPAGWDGGCGEAHDDGGLTNCKPWPRMPGFYDLITVEVARPKRQIVDGEEQVWVVPIRLWDFKTTSSFDWAKTAEELAEDPQVLLYALHAMQTFGLDSIECNWVYLLTEGKPKSYVVSVVVTRADAERAVIEMAHTAAEVVDTVRLFKAGRLRVVDLDRDVSACTAYGGCVYHTDKGGPCDAKVSPGKALRQKAALEQKIQARKDARKEATMALSFEERKKQREAEKNAAAGNGAGAPDPTAGGTSVPPDAGGGGESAAASSAGDGAANGPGGEEASKASSAATTKLRENKASGVVTKSSRVAAPSDTVHAVVTFEGVSVALPSKSPLYAAVVKICRAQKTLDFALMGE